MSKAVSRIASVFFLAVMLAGCAGDGEIRPGNTAVINFGAVYVGTAASCPLTIEETKGFPVDIVGFGLAGPDYGRFSVSAPPVPPAARVPAIGTLTATVAFWPDEARRFGDAELTPHATGGRARGFPVTLRGDGVFQKHDVWLDIAAVHPPDGPLDFGRLELGQSAQRGFIVENTSNQDLALTLVWVKPDGQFSAPGGTSVTVPSHGQATIALLFQPSVVGVFDAVVELRGAGSAPACGGGGAMTMAGIVLRGEGLPTSATATGASLSPLVADPGAQMALTYTLSHPDGLQSVTSATLEGLPSNATGGYPLPLPLPAASNGAVNYTFPLGPPAMDGIYPVKLVIRHRAAGDTVVDLGTLVVKDTPATIHGLAVVADSHRRSRCAPGFVARQLVYRVTDNNGAGDLLNARIQEIRPPENAEPLISTPITIPLAVPGINQVSDNSATQLNINCPARIQTWTLDVRIDEDDRSVNPPIQTNRFQQDTPYRVIE